MSNKKENLQLFVSFLKVGSFMFGGGYAMLPLLERELVEQKRWIAKDELLEILSVSQMTPGTIAINAATYIGNKRGGILGGILASAGIILPSLVIVTVIYFLMGHNMTNEYVQKAFLGIRACLVAMIAQSGYKMFKTGINNHISFFIFLLALAGLFLGLNPVYAILGGIIAGFAIFWLSPYFIKKDRQGGEVK